MSTFLVVGAGITGATIAERLAAQGHQVIIIDKRSHIAGNCYDSTFENTDVLVQRYGPHVFHTNSPRIWDYVNQFAKFRPYLHRVLGHTAGLHPFPIPANLNTFYSLFGRVDCKRYAGALMDTFPPGAEFNLSQIKDSQNATVQEFRSRIYHTIYEGYIKKHWGPYADQIDDSVLNRVPIRLSHEEIFFADKYQGVPIGGYTAMIEKMLSNKNINYYLNVPYSSGNWHESTKIIWTGPIDQYFDYQYGHLPYRSLEFRNLVTKSHEKIMSCGQYVFNDESVPITRTIEHRWLTGQESIWTVRTSEFPCEYVPGKNEPFYPVPCASSQELYYRYAALARTMKDKVLFAGRLGRYQYLSMDQAVAGALALLESEREFFN
jgi:UDP-galactopyranose mutase